MQGPIRSESGIAYPGDLKLLCAIFERTCRTHGLRKGSLEAEDLGRAAMSLFSEGVFDEDELVENLTGYVRLVIGRR